MALTKSTRSKHVQERTFEPMYSLSEVAGKLDNVEALVRS